MRLAVLLVLCGCRQILGFEGVAATDGSTADTAIDVTVSGTCAGSPAGLLPSTCFDPVPDPALVITGIIDTSDDALCAPSRADLCIVAAESIVVNGTLVARGSRPLVVWSATTIDVPAGAKIDVRSIETPGAGANDAACPGTDGVSDTAFDPQVGTGGCGGGFATDGGQGGAGSVMGQGVVDLTCGSGVVALDRIRGGCRGGHGGHSNAVGSLNGGSSGGAVYLVAVDSISIAGLIDARGTRAKVASGNAARMAGGGGGGSGGLIAFDAPIVSLDGAILVALGAGGSSGVGSNGGSVIQGNIGQDATLNPPGPAPGAAQTVISNSGGATGVDGGDVSPAQTGGGGGGGGGNGFIVAFASQFSMANTTSAPAVIRR